MIHGMIPLTTQLVPPVINTLLRTVPEFGSAADNVAPELRVKALTFSVELPLVPAATVVKKELAPAASVNCATVPE